MDTKNPLSVAQGASVSIGPDAKLSNSCRPRLQASPAARLRLAALLWKPSAMEADHG